MSDNQFKIIGNMLKKIVYQIKQVFWLLLCLRVSEYRISKIPKGAYKGKKAMIMGNGPSLKDLLQNYREGMVNITEDSFFVNFAPLDDVFFLIKPKHYLLSDLGFSRDDPDYTPSLRLLYTRLQNKVDWDLTIYVTRKNKTLCDELVSYSQITNSHIKFIYVYKRYCDILQPTWRHWLYKHGFFMPSEGTVVNTAIYIAILEGYEEIELYGVDTDMFKYMFVDNDNVLYLEDNHFYGKEKIRGKQDISNEYSRVYEFLQTCCRMLRTYEMLKLFADYMNVRIFNCTPYSMIDSFPRKPFFKK